jgi:hypothetical protein
LSTFGRSGRVYDLREDDTNSAWEASGRGSVSLGLRRGGCRKKKGREEEEGGRKQEVEMRK